MPDVFISYARADQPFVRRLEQALTTARRDVWVDWLGPEPTADWQVEVTKAIESSRAFVAIISPDFAVSESCREELEQAHAMGKRLVPVVYREVPANDLNPSLRRLHWLWAPEVSLDFIDSLVRALDIDLEWVSTHTMITRRAAEWERAARSTGLLVRGDALRQAEDEVAALPPDKTPQLTRLQHEYLIASRRAVARSQRRVIRGLALAAVVLACAAGFALVQMTRANKSEKEAVAQSELALSRSLASQANEIINTTPSSMQTALLLAIESMRREPSVTASSLVGQLVPFLRSLSTSLNHEEPISKIAVSADGRYLATAGSSTIRIWELGSGTQVAVANQGANVNAIAFSPDGRTLASGGSDNTARVWETETGREVTRRTHGDPVLAVVFSADGKLIASASGFARVGQTDLQAAHDGSVRIWKSETGEEVTRLVHDDSVYAVAFSPDGTLVASASRDGSARLWRIDGTPFERSDTDNEVVSVAFSPDGRLVAMGSVNGSVQIVNTSTGSHNVTLHVGETVGILKFAPDGRYLITADGGDPRSTLNTALVWSTDARYPFVVEPDPLLEEEVVAELGYEDSVDAVAFSPDGHYIAYGGGLHSQETSVKVWDNIAKREVARIPHDSRVVDLAYTPDGKRMVTASVDGKARIWNLDAQPEQFVGAQSTEPHTGLARVRISDINFAPYGTRLAAGANDGSASIWDIADPSYYGRFEDETNIGAVDFTADGRFLILGANRHVYVKDYEAGTQVTQFAVPEPDLIGSVAVSPAGRYLAAGTINPSDYAPTPAHLYLWDIDREAQLLNIAVEPTKELADFTFLRSYAGSVLFSPDGRYVAFSDWVDGTVRVVTVPNGDEVAVLRHRSEADQSPGVELDPIQATLNPIEDLAFSPDSKLIASAGRDGTARVWDLASGDELARVSHQDWVTNVSFSPDGQWVASAGGRIDRASLDNSIHIWSASRGSLRTVVTHDGAILGLSFSPTGNYLASYGADDLVRIWDLDGQLIREISYDETTPRFDQPNGGSQRSTRLPITSMSWSSNGKYLAVAVPGFVMVSLINPNDLIFAACNTLTRNLSPAEWQRYLGNEPYRETCANLPGADEPTPPAPQPTPNNLEVWQRRLDQYVDKLRVPASATDWLLDHLDPAVLRLYTSEQCRSFIARRPSDPTLTMRVGWVEGPRAWTFSAASTALLVENVYSVEATVGHEGDVATQTVHFTLVDGELRWFTRCEPEMTTPTSNP